MQLTRSYSFLRLCVLGLACVAGPFTYATPRIVAPGNPPLTSDIVVKAAGFFEWVLDVRFTPAQQQEYEQIMAREWADESKRRSTMDLMQNVDKLSKLPEATKQSVHQQVQVSMLEGMRKSGDDPDSQWMLAVYNAAHPGGAAPVKAVAEAGMPHYAALDQRQIVGKWRATRSGSVQYGNAATGALAPTNGSSFAYQFNADGTYVFSGLLQVTTYGCHTAVYTNDSGKYHLEGDHLFVNPADGRVKVEQNCGSTGNTDKPANLNQRESVIHFELNSNPPVLVLESPTTKARPDYFRAEK